MTYQELLVEFSKRRANDDPVLASKTAIADLQWAIQAILEKLRDAEKTSIG